jgi:hypothetical protein
VFVREATPPTPKGFKPMDLIPTIPNKMTIGCTNYQHWTCRSPWRIEQRSMN